MYSGWLRNLSKDGFQRRIFEPALSHLPHMLLLVLLIQIEYTFQSASLELLSGLPLGPPLHCPLEPAL